MNTDDPYTILSIDGGGIRGLIPAVVCAELEAATGTPISDMFDMIVGTSTGSILATGLARPGDGGEPYWCASDTVDIFHEDGPDIFDAGALGSLDDAVDPRYSLSQLQKPLERRIGPYGLHEARTRVVAPAYDLKGRRPIIFDSEASKHSSSMRVTAANAALASSAAPSYFPPVEVQLGAETAYCVDGGLYAANPVMIGISRALERHALDDLFVVSLGTGDSDASIPLGDAEGWGALQWAKPIIASAMDATADVAHRQASSVLSLTRYLRFDRSLTWASPEMDDAKISNLAALEREAVQLLKDRSDDVEALIETLSQ